MKLKFSNLLFVLLIIIPLGCKKSDKIAVDFLITNVRVLDVVNNTINENQTIAVLGNRIEAIVLQEHIENYQAKTIIDGQGNFAMPGLWDNHVHFRGGDSLIPENKRMLPLYMSYGITTVRDAGGDITNAVLKWKEDIGDGSLIGPMIFTSGPKLDGENASWEGSLVVRNKDEAYSAIDSLEKLKTDYVKIYDSKLSKEAFYEILKESEKRGLMTTGHMPLSSDVLTATKLGLDGTEHLYYILKSCSPKMDSIEQINKGYGMLGAIAETYDESWANMVFDTLAMRNHFNTPTLYIGNILSNLADDDHSKDSLLPYMGKGIVKTYERRIKAAKAAKLSPNRLRSSMGRDKFAQMVKPMFDAGIHIMAGSDCGAYNSYVYPGESLIGELKALVEAGLTTQEALLTSIYNGPLFFNVENDYVSLEAGKIADILLLKKNPLEQINNLGSIQTVISHGKANDKNELFKMFTSSSM
ncbi:amidohydrolase family protein [Aegicerativicinus sediminis]|uniref:amidohydrolase family protein n=1 Tax=Aegicerativicinus sediminis TaxID=2893202 RepID=UPI001E4F6F86|nr:amidohydrolase family protein [Aegicerativicinus sediminis]